MVVSETINNNNNNNNNNNTVLDLYFELSGNVELLIFLCMPGWCSIGDHGL